MLNFLHLKNVGPSPEMEMHLASRLNLITGDNGLGKSFLLDVIWWALTRRWPQQINSRLNSGYVARPTDPKKSAIIEFGLTSKTQDVTYTSKYVARDESWTGKAGRPWNPGLVIYAHADGGFSVWDPARNYWKTRGDIDVQERLPGYVFAPKEVWDGLEAEVGGKTTPVCNGLLRDWASWILQGGVNAKKMAAVLSYLSPSREPHDLLEPGPLTRVTIDDVRDIPSLKSAYSESIPILHASAGIRRIVALAYMFLWTWDEHQKAATKLGEKFAPQVVLLIDELESHLHPRWQRSILGSLLKLATVLHKSARIQLVAATHSPLVLASAEPIFDPDTDAWFDLDMSSDRRVKLEKRPFERRGDISNWLTSEAFDLKEPRSLEAEEAITKALALVRSQKAGKREIEAVSNLLRASLGEVDRFWLRWTSFLESRETNT